jgi:hypothetical protein
VTLRCAATGALGEVSLRPGFSPGAADPPVLAAAVAALGAASREWALAVARDLARSFGRAAAEYRAAVAGGGRYPSLPPGAPAGTPHPLLVPALAAVQVRPDASGLAWSGLVWSGLVWSGPVRSGPVWSGLVWSGLVWSGLVWSGLVRSGPVRSGPVRSGLVWTGLVWSHHSIIFNGRIVFLLSCQLRLCFCVSHAHPVTRSDELAITVTASSSASCWYRV